MTSPFDLTGKTALVTGSSRGLGFAFVQGLAEAGAKVFLNGTSEERLSAAVASLKAQGHQASGIRFDVTDEAAVVGAFKTLDAAGEQVDILINNAGIQFRSPMVDLPLAEWQKVIDTNLTSTFLVGREAARRMIVRGKGGKIINIGSLTSQAARPTIAAYTAAKGGVRMLTKSMAAEWGGFDIQTNAIGPGYIVTDLNADLIANKEFDAWVKNGNPARRWGLPVELAGTAVYLASSASNYVNGQMIFVDGGWLATL